MIGKFALFPDEASSMAASIDKLFFFNIAVALFFSLLTASTVVFLAVRYHHRRRVDRSSPPMMIMPLEIAWTAIPLAIALILFASGASVFFRLHDPPADALQIDVVGKQWMWKLQHPNGRREIDELHVPLGWPVRLRMISQDVIHSFFIPAFRVKQDVLPGKYSSLWFRATRLGEYHIFCAQYCGTSHAAMIGRVVVMPPAEYQKWLEGSAAQAASSAPQGFESPVAQGARLFEKMGCSSCHRAPNRRAPLLEGLYGRPVLLKSGKTVIADDDYIRESILYPNAKIVAGFDPIMPTFKGQLSEEDILHLIDYIRSLQKGQGAPSNE